jgi:hypothetical protein
VPSRRPAGKATEDFPGNRSSDCVRGAPGDRRLARSVFRVVAAMWNHDREFALALRKRPGMRDGLASRCLYERPDKGEMDFARSHDPTLQRRDVLRRHSCGIAAQPPRRNPGATVSASHGTGGKTGDDREHRSHAGSDTRQSSSGSWRGSGSGERIGQHPARKSATILLRAGRKSPSSVYQVSAQASEIRTALIIAVDVYPRSHHASSAGQVGPTRPIRTGCLPEPCARLATQHSTKSKHRALFDADATASRTTGLFPTSKARTSEDGPSSEGIIS